MRKFFVYFLILGVLAATALLTWAQQQQLPHIVTTGYSEDGYHTQLAINSGGTLEDTVTAAKAEVAQQIFRNVKSVFNPRQKQAKNKWVPVEEVYGPVVYNIQNILDSRPTNAHLVKHFSQPQSQNGYVYVNVKEHALRQAYLEKENALNRQINTLLAQATQAEAVNPEQALQAYLQASPLFEQLKEAVLIQQAATPQQNQDPAAILAKLMETATGTNGGALKMSYPDVTRRINQIQNQGRLAQNVQQIATSIAQQLSAQASRMGGRKGKIVLDSFTYGRSYGNSTQQSAMSVELETLLGTLLANDGWAIEHRRRGALPLEVSFTLQGNIRSSERGAGLQIQATVQDLNTGYTVGNSVMDLDPDFAAASKPENYDAMQVHSNAMQEREMAAIAVNSQPQRPSLPITGQALNLQVWTDKTTYFEGDRMTVSCRVDQPAYVRLIYVLADANGQGVKYTLLHDNTHIQQVGSDVIIGQFLIAPPFGSEQLIALAQKEPFAEIPTVKQNGYNYIAAQSAQDAVDLIFPPLTRGAQPINNETTLSVTTKKRSW